MNIFILDLNHADNVKMYCDQHLRKMLIETAQLLSSAYYFTNQEHLAQYKLTHANHPSAKWCRESINNWSYLQILGVCMSVEYKNRFDKSHKSGEIIENMLAPNIKCEAETLPPIVVPDSLRCGDIVKSYRRLYRYKYMDWLGKKHSMKWTNRQIPDFMKDLENIKEI